MFMFMVMVMVIGVIVCHESCNLGLVGFGIRIVGNEATDEPDHEDEVQSDSHDPMLSVSFSCFVSESDSDGVVVVVDVGVVPSA